MKKFEEIKGLCKIVDLKKLRRTEGVFFDAVPDEFIKDLSGVDRVIHISNAVSPGSIKNVERPWYMHPYQSDNLLVLSGIRHIDLYSKEHGKVENFVVTNNKIFMNGELVCDQPAVLTWPPHVFHRVESKEQGSSSINFAQRTDGFDIKDNFSIYDLNVNTGDFHVIREGHRDQF
ncbi:hypothetical protein KQ51_01602 [Candidatus Izimaplasma bacterium HR1]|jgi:hypothetical protein|uniref:hypothetical protein n=1 Tax=Candidatus Izimoplasma sp. HR1 TaxID=1541959 RepID=UPI0004F68007|nr:hypothetical protein KQ51_01602 [Candidatus Izimaplasma bacterium HR1]